MAMRPIVSSAVALKARPLDSSLVEDAVSEALTQMLAAGEHVGDPEEVKERWILYAKRRAIDIQRSAEYRRRDPVPVDDHALALALSVTDDITQASEQERAEWRAQEQLNELEGDERVWVEAWYDQILAGSLPAGAQPRGLAQAFGWTPAKTKSLSHRTRLKMVAFAQKRASGQICEERRALIEDFITASNGNEFAGGLDEKRYKQVLFHVAGCESCRAAWDTRRRSALGRALALVPLPLGGFADVARALREKLAGLSGAVHSATYSVRHRLGVGGGAGAVVAGGGAASLGGKAAAICTAVVCAAAAGGSALVTAVPGVLPFASHHATHHSVRHPRRAAPTPPQNARVASFTPTVTTPAATVAPHATAPPPTTGSGTSKTPTFTPGDLQPAGTQSAPTSSGAHAASVTSKTPATSPVSHAPTEHPQRQPTCTPGDLGC